MSIVKLFDELWLTRWNKYPFALHTKQFYKKPDKSKACKVMNLNKHDVSLLINFVSGHNNLAYHLSKEDDEVNPTCWYCNTDDETAVHWAPNCPTLQLLRVDTFLDVSPCDDDWSVDQMIKFIKSPLIRNPLENGTAQ